MKVIATALLMLSCASGLAIAQEGPAPAAPIPSVPAADRPTEDSVRQLLQVMHAKTVLEQMSKQMDGMFTGIINRELGNKTLTPEQQKRVDEARQRYKDLMGQLLSWDSMEPVYLKTYGESFTQSEIDSMIAFYSSPAGQSVISKLPLAMQNAMAAMQTQLKSLIPQVQQIAKDTATEINNEHARSGKPATG